jgi:hypothetical protein
MAAYWQLNRNAPIGRLVSADADVEVRLGPGEVFSLNGDRRGWKIACERGKLWITQFDDPDDHPLGQGQEFWVSKTGTVVIQGLPRGEARVSTSPPTAHC